MSAPHIPPIPTVPMVDPATGMPTLQQAMWTEQLLQSRQPWTLYVPVITGLGTPSVLTASYMQAGKAVYVQIQIVGVSDGTLPTFTLPFPADRTSEVLVAVIGSGGLNKCASCIINPVGLATLANYDGSAPTNGVTYGFGITGVYEAA